MKVVRGRKRCAGVAEARLEPFRSLVGMEKEAATVKTIAVVSPEIIKQNDHVIQQLHLWIGTP